jgi:hypothetical protein
MEDLMGTLKAGGLPIQVVPLEIPEIKKLASTGGVLN